MNIKELYHHTAEKAGSSACLGTVSSLGEGDPAMASLWL